MSHPSLILGPSRLGRIDPAAFISAWPTLGEFSGSKTTGRLASPRISGPITLSRRGKETYGLAEAAFIGSRPVAFGDCVVAMSHSITRHSAAAPISWPTP